MKKIRILLAGAGGYGANYLMKLLAESPDWELAGIADPFIAASSHYDEIKRRNIPVYKSPEEFYKDEKADLAVISSPIHTHVAYTALALDRGSNVLCEKPFSADLDQLDGILQKEKETGRFVAVGFQFCYAPAIIALKKDIIAGLYGKPRCLKTLWLPRRGDAYYSRNNWAGKLNFEGVPILDSPLNNACAHELQLIVFLLGKDLRSSADISSLDAELWRVRKEIENFDAVALRAKTDGGAELFFYAAHCVEQVVIGPWGEYIFEKGTVRWGERSTNLVAEFADGSVKDYGPDTGENNMRKLDDAIEATRNGGRPLCDLTASRTQVKSVIMAQKFPIAEPAPEKITRGQSESGDPFLYVPGLDEALIRSYREGRLPRELGYAF